MTKRAVIVGVDDYSAQFGDDKNNLGGCVADATSVYGLLRDGLGFDAGELTYLVDADATRDSVLAAIAAMLAASEAGDVACLFYAGHGARQSGDPSDASASRYYEAIVPASGAWITDDDLLGLAGSLEPGTVNFTVLLDCCHAGGFHESAPDERARTLAYDQALISAMESFMTTIIPCGVCLPLDATDMDGNVGDVHGDGNGVVCSVDDDKSLVQRSRSTVLAACRYDEVDVERDGHGALTAGLLEVLDGGASTPSYRALVDRLREAMQRRGLSQTPTLLGQESRVDELFCEGWTTSA